MMRTLLHGLLLLLVFLTVLASGGSAQSVLELPLRGRVMDHANLLTSEAEGLLTEQLAQHEASTTNQVVVLTLFSLDGRSVEEVANVLFNRWGLGQDGRDNGVLLLVAREDRELRIEVGLGLEGDLTDAEAGRIIRNVIVPAFRGDDYQGGILSGVSAILGTIEGTYTPVDDGGGDEDMPWWFGLIFLVSHVLVPGYLAVRALILPPLSRYPTLLFSLMFIAPMLLFFSTVLFDVLPFVEHDPQSGGSPIAAGALLMGGFLLLWIGVDVYMSRSEKWQGIREQVREAQKKGKKTRIDAGWMSFSAGGSSSSGGSGGGFSGGGGSSGGGGASGSW